MFILVLLGNFLMFRDDFILIISLGLSLFILRGIGFRSLCILKIEKEMIYFYKRGFILLKR